ncbi:hypothetical protein KC867_01180 [Candidatus Saccharibacteria bacterium]|nr:hypothetical protein [Candidatus Saccharibacteria bacterium]
MSKTNKNNPLFGKDFVAKKTLEDIQVNYDFNLERLKAQVGYRPAESAETDSQPAEASLKEKIAFGIGALAIVALSVIGYHNDNNRPETMRSTADDIEFLQPTIAIDDQK